MRQPASQDLRGDRPALQGDRPAPRHDRPAPRGFTLIEILVTLAVISIVTALVAPSIVSRLVDAPTTRSARLLKGLLEEARGAAATGGRTVSVVWEPEARRFLLERPGRDRALPVPREVDVAIAGFAPAARWGPEARASGSMASAAGNVEGAAGILFFPLGGSTGGSVALGHGSSRIALRVDPLTGYIRYGEGS